MDYLQLLHQAWLERENYKVIDHPEAAEPDLCVIYFSSYGSFSASNTASRLQADYYEFHRNPVRRAGRHIYVRDVSLLYYKMGINKDVNDVNKLLELLKKLTTGYRVVTVGVSTGGYMAMLAGAYLKAKYIISVSGQVDTLPDKKWMLKLGVDWLIWRDLWDDTRQIVQDSKVPVFQIEAANCKLDHSNAKKMAKLPNVHFFNIDSDLHGGQLNVRCINRLLNMNFEQISALQRQFNGKIITQWQINKALLPLSGLMSLYLTKLRKKLFKKRRKS